MKTQYTPFEKFTLQAIADLMDNNNAITFDALQLYYKIAHQAEKNASERTQKQTNYYHSK